MHVYLWQRGAQIFQRNVHTKKAKKREAKYMAGAKSHQLNLATVEVSSSWDLGVQQVCIYIFLESGASGMLLSCWLHPEPRNNCWSPSVEGYATPHLVTFVCETREWEWRRADKTWHPCSQHQTTSRGMLGRASRQHSTAFTQWNNFSWGLRIGAHVLFIQIAFPHSRNLHSSLRYRSCSISSCLALCCSAPISTEYLHVETDQQ